VLTGAVRPALVALALLAATLVATAPTAAAQAGEAGSVQFAKAAEASFDAFTQNPSNDQKQWMRSHYERMRAYAPYFDSRLSWFPDAWAYQDAYAIYRTSPVATEHPEWILKDAAGNKLYIPFGCSGGTCPQYAGDFGNPAFRDWWIESATSKMAKGYRGLFVDDVNMDWRVGNGAGAFVAPRDPRTGTTMTEANWRRYMADFTEQIRAALPGKEIIHNALWFAGCGSATDSCWSDPHIRRELLAADYIELERGLNDAGITGGGGRFGYETFMSRVDWLHSQGKAVVFDSQAGNAAGREYGLANYLLVSTGRDLLGNDPGGTPADWWAGYDVELGAPRGGRHAWNGLIRRDFERGIVLVNKPGGARRTVELPAGSTGPDGEPRPAVELGGAEGAVVVTRDSSGPDPEPSPEETRTEVYPRPNPAAPAAGKPTEKPASRPRTRTRRLSRAVLVRGRVRRARAGRVRIRLQRNVAGRWVQVRRTRVAVRHGRFRKLFRGLPAGRYRVRAAYLGSATATVSRSHARRFHIRP
jgi:hypothetical protein